jgi:hypothetical protein
MSVGNQGHASPDSVIERKVVGGLVSNRETALSNFRQVARGLSPRRGILPPLNSKLNHAQITTVVGQNSIDVFDLHYSGK